MYIATWIFNTLGCASVYGVSSIALIKAYPASSKEIERQITTAAQAIPSYALLPTLIDILIDLGITRAYTGVFSRGLIGYIFNVLCHLLFVEFAVYWIHRMLHDKSYYWIHRLHHSFREHLTPFAGLAFNPADGLLQACPYLLALFFIPIHRGTHKLMLFCTGLWTSFIHSEDKTKYRFVLGPLHHKIHHQTYNYNFGHYTQLMDSLFGTLRGACGPP